MRKLLIILNKNEGYGLKIILPKLDKSLFEEVLCIDGGSTDDSLSILSEFGISVLSQISKGRGAAFNMALKLASHDKFDYVFFLSSDGNEDVSDLSKFVRLAQNNYDLIIASRMLPESRNEEDDQYLRFRKWGNIAFSILAWIFYSRKRDEYISDPINGFRALKVSTWRDINIKSDGFSVEFETSIKSYKYKLRVKEFPTIEGDRLGGSSGAKAVKTTWAMTKTLFLNI